MANQQTSDLRPEGFEIGKRNLQLANLEPEYWDTALGSSKRMKMEILTTNLGKVWVRS